MFEVPEWAECSAANVPGLPVCHRSVVKMVTIMGSKQNDAVFESLGACNRHVEVIEAHLGSQSDLPPLTMPKSEFPDFMAEMLRSAGA